MNITKNQLEIIKKLQDSSSNLVSVLDNSTVTRDPQVWRVRRKITGSVTRGEEDICSSCGSPNELYVLAEFNFEAAVDPSGSGEDRWRFIEAQVGHVNFRSVKSATAAIDRFKSYQGHLKRQQLRSMLEGLR